MPEEVWKNIIALEADKSSFRKTEQEFGKAGKAHQKLTQEFERSLLAADDLGNITAKASKKAVAGIEKQTKAQKALNAELKQTLSAQEQNEKIRGEAGSIGDVESSLLAVSGGGAGLGLQTEGLAGVASLFELTEALPQLAGAAKAAPGAILNTAKALGPTGIGLVAVAGAAAIALSEVAKVVAAAERELTAALEAQRSVVEFAREGATAEDARARVAELEQIITDEQKLLEARNADLARGSQAADAQLGILSGAVQQFGLAGFGTIKDEIKTSEEAIADAQAEIRELNSALDEGTFSASSAAEAERQLAAERDRLASTQLNTLIQFADASVEQIDDAIKKNERLIEIRQEFLETALISEEERLRIEKEISDLTVANFTLQTQARGEAFQREQNATEDSTKAVEDREKALKRITAFEIQAADAVAKFNEQRERTLEDRRVRDERAEEDFNQSRIEASRKFQDKLTEIERDGNDKIADLRSELSGIDTQVNKDIQQVNAEFMRDQLDELDSFRREEQKREAAYKKERLRALDDLHDDQLTAELNNDVNAFLARQAEYDKQQARRREDFGDETNERQADLQARQEAAREARELEIANIRQAASERRTALQQEIAEERAATQQKMEALRQQYAEEERAAQQAFQRKQQRQAQDDARADARARQDLQRQLQGIQQKAQAELAAIRSTVGATRELEAAALRVRNIAAGIGSGSSSRRSSPSRSLGSNLRASVGREFAEINKAIRLAQIRQNPTGRAAGGFAFAEGGIVTRPTLGLLGERNPEAILPLKPSRGLARDLDQIFRGRGIGGGGSNVTVNMPVTIPVSDGNLRDDIADAMQQSADMVLTLIHEDLATARQGL